MACVQVMLLLSAELEGENEEEAAALGSLLQAVITELKLQDEVKLFVFYLNEKILRAFWYFKVRNEH